MENTGGIGTAIAAEGFFQKKKRTTVKKIIIMWRS